MYDYEHSSYVADVGLEAVQIDEAIDPFSCECIHAPLVVGGFVDVVDSDCIRSELLHKVCITLALFGIDKRIVFDELVGNTCIRPLLDNIRQLE